MYQFDSYCAKIPFYTNSGIITMQIVTNKELKQEHLKITKTNLLAHAGSDLTTIEAKILEYCFANVFKKQNITAQDVFEVDIAAMSAYFNLTRSNAYRELKQVFQTLMSKQLKIDWLGTRTQTPWLSALRYNDEQGLLQIQLSPIVCDHISHRLLQTECFTQYHLTDVAGLKHRFSIILFNYFKSISYKTSEKRLEFTLEDLRELFFLEDKEFTTWGIFKRQLEKNCTEIQLKTGLLVELKERKTGKKVTSVVFLLS
jgi:plasmid replication initiation protein